MDSPYIHHRNEIDNKDRLIVALDVPSFSEAKFLVEKLGDSTTFYKLGLELFMAGDYIKILEWLREKDKKVFVDLKFFDVPNTVRSAVSQLKGRGATFATVHGNEEMLKAAVAEKNDTKILAVTMLTSYDNNDAKDMGFQCNIEDVVLSRAKRALAIGCDGVISSGLEAPALRKKYGDGFIIVTPGIRPGLNDEAPVDDQKRTVDVEQAFKNGADYIVVGRPIRTAPSPADMATLIQNRIAKHFNHNPDDV